MFGESQYTERDIIFPMAGNNKKESANLYLRKLVVGSSELNLSKVSHSNGAEPEETTSMDTDETPSNDIDCPATGESSNSSANQIIESLKTKIREYEQHISSKCKCLICMDEFRIPVVSICCWHVHCEECWLRTLGARKLCPQCNMITSPADLRRIYM